MISPNGMPLGLLPLGTTGSSTNCHKVLLHHLAPNARHTMYQWQLALTSAALMTYEQGGSYSYGSRGTYHRKMYRTC